MFAIRNEITGEEKNFPDKQAAADFLHTREDKPDWDTGRLGKLPEPTTEEKPADPVPAKVAVDDGRRADESAGRHLVDPVHNEDASAESQAKADADKKAAADEAEKTQREQAEAATAAEARNAKARNATGKK